MDAAATPSPPPLPHKWPEPNAASSGRLPGARTLLGLLIVAATILPPLPTAAQSPTDPAYDTLQPTLNRHCVVCHSGDAAPVGLRLDSYDAILAGSSRGPVVKAGAPAESELIRRIKGESQPRMPLTGPPFLSDEEITAFEQWVSNGLDRGTGQEMAMVAPMPLRPAAGEPVTYSHVAPILAQRCVKCHIDNGLMGPAPEGYRLTSYAATLSASDRARVVPGMPDASELVRRIRGQAHPRMPFDGPPYLDEEEIGLIEAWIAQGARDTGGTPAAVPRGARVRLHGTLGSDMTLDGLALTLGRGSRIDKSPMPGDYVQVRGWLDPAGKVVVERLRRR